MTRGPGLLTRPPQLRSGAYNNADPTVRDFFISYTRRDRAWAEWIAWTLEENGHSVYLQAWDFRPGSNFVLEIPQAATDARKTLLVLSPAYLAAEYTQPE